MELELLSDAHADQVAELHAIRYEEAVQDYMAELGCTRQIAEILCEQEAGANPDAWWPS